MCQYANVPIEEIRVETLTINYLKIIFLLF